MFRCSNCCSEMEEIINTHFPTNGRRLSPWWMGWMNDSLLPSSPPPLTVRTPMRRYFFMPLGNSITWKFWSLEGSCCCCCSCCNLVWSLDWLSLFAALIEKACDAMIDWLIDWLIDGLTEWMILYRTVDLSLFPLSTLFSFRSCGGPRQLLWWMLYVVHVHTEYKVPSYGTLLEPATTAQCCTVQCNSSDDDGQTKPFHIVIPVCSVGGSGFHRGKPASQIEHIIIIIHGGEPRYRWRN